MTDIILNQHTPGGVMKQLADAAGGVVYDQYAAGGCVGQLYAAAGADVTLDQYAEGGPLHQIELEIEGGGGGDTPDWVPANAVIHIDLVGGDPQGRAWVEGTGVVAVDTLLGNDPNTTANYEETLYDPAALVASGYSKQDATDGHPPAFIGLARTKFLEGTTIRVQFKEGDTQLVSRSTDDNAAIQMDIGVDGVQAYSNGPFGTETYYEFYNNVGDGSAVNAVAITFTATRFEFAVNGNDPVAGVLVEADLPVESPLSYVVFYTDMLQSITLYDPLPSTAGLSELSETGVTNTAPTNLNIIWADADPYGSNGTYLETLFGEGDHIGLCQFSVDDAEGNPILLSLVDDSDGNLQEVLNNPGSPPTLSNFLVGNAVLLTAGEYDFTVRATDPGGLYVEQEFTVTVTA
jgi:hypothetical protein